MELNVYFETIHDPAMLYLTKVVDRLEDAFRKPELIPVCEIEQWRYPKLTVEHMCILRAVRIISALNATKVLLREGYVQEIAVLLRTIDEFQEDIVFLMENYPSEDLSPAQQKFMEEYGKEEYTDPRHPFKEQTERVPPSRKKIKASVARFLTPIVNPSDSQRTSQVATDCLSGYVHGAYPHIMELYGGPPPDSHFYMTGMLGTPHQDLFMRMVAMHLQRTIPIFGFMCQTFGVEDEFWNLYHMKNWSLQALRTLGIKTEESPADILKKIKNGSIK